MKVSQNFLFFLFSFCFYFDNIIVIHTIRTASTQLSGQSSWLFNVPESVFILLQVFILLLRDKCVTQTYFLSKADPEIRN